jgi:hypothetical protein
MSPERLIPLTIIASGRELPPADHIWGDGGWRIPEEREALDWLTLGPLLGWDPVILYAEDPLPADVLAKSRIIVCAVDPNELRDESCATLQRVLLHHPVALIARAAPPGTRWGAWAYASSAPWCGETISRKQVSEGQVFTLACHPSALKPPLI